MPKRANMNGTAGGALVQVARVYLRVSTHQQALQRQEAIITAARAAGYYVAGVYREKASGARADRPELLRMVADLQLGEGVVAEKIDRISRLPLTEAGRLGGGVRAQGGGRGVAGGCCGVVVFGGVGAVGGGDPRQGCAPGRARLGRSV